MSKVFLFILGLVLLTGCNTDKEQDIDDLRENQRKWESLNEVQYELTFNYSAFSPISGDYQIFVVNEEVQTALYKGFDRDDIEEYQGNGHFVYEVASVSKMFEKAEEVISNAEGYTVEYHDEFGYPIHISADYSKQVADDEVTYRITQLHRGADTTCDTQAIAGINLKLTLEGQLSTNTCDAVVYIEDEDYVEQLDTCSENTFSGVWERAGHYKVTASLPGYKTASIADVTVYPFLCHVGVRSLEIALIEEG